MYEAYEKKSTIKVFIGTILIFSLFIGITNHFEYKTIRVQQEALIQLENDNVSAHHLALMQDSYIQILQDDIKVLEQARITALKESTLVGTLLNENMEDWTVDSILYAKSLFDTIPYGSPFESGHYITSPFGSKEPVGNNFRDTYNGHRGVDIRPNDNDDKAVVHATVDGKVLTWGRNDRVYGNYIEVLSSDGMYLMKYGHLSSIALIDEDGNFVLKEGMEFTNGDRLGRMGATGHATGPHVHLEIYINEDGNWRLLNADAIIDYIG